MRNRKEIEKRILEITPEFERAEEAYFSIIEEKQDGGEIYQADFLKIESEYEILKKEVETLQWVLEAPSIIITTEHKITKEKKDESTLSN